MADQSNPGRRRRATSASQDRLNVPPPAGAGGGGGGAPLQPSVSRETLRSPSTIRIRRLTTTSTTSLSSRPSSRASDEGPPEAEDSDTVVAGRRRSSSAPQQRTSQSLTPSGDLSRQITTASQQHMGTITEGQPTGQYEEAEAPLQPTRSLNVQRPATSHAAATTDARNTPQRTGRLRRFRSGTTVTHPRHRVAEDEYDSDVVDLLDLVDPEVHTLGTLTNVQNSLFVPDLGGLLNRRPTYDLTPRTTDVESRPRTRAGTWASQRPAPSRLPTMPETAHGIEMEPRPRPKRAGSPSSQLSESHYAVLPHGVDLQGWTQEDIDDLNDHVRHMLHSRREGFKRSMRGFRKYLSRPLGLFVFVYAVLVTLFGAAWVFCLIGWIYVGSQQDYFINVIDNILVAFFALMGDGLAPFRAVDTYHMCFIAHYYHLTWRLRREKQLPDLVDHNDLPDRRVSIAEEADIMDKEETAEFSVLSPRQQKRLQYHQAKFSKTHTFYKPHETATHHAFPLRLLVAIVVLLDCHSLFQVALGTCTWSIDYRVRPQALTATILSCSITCNIVAGVLISVGDHRTRKKEVLERLFRQDLTQEAIRHVEKRRTIELQRGAGNSFEAATEGRSSGTDAGNSGPSTNTQPPERDDSDVPEKKETEP